MKLYEFRRLYETMDEYRKAEAIKEFMPKFFDLADASRDCWKKLSLDSLERMKYCLDELGVDTYVKKQILRRNKKEYEMVDVDDDG